MLNKTLRSMRLKLSKLRFSLGLNPKIEGEHKEYKKYVPDGFKSVCLISADFEMAWAYRYLYGYHEADFAVKQGMQTRRNVPIILDLCDTYSVPITWATVGHLFLESCGPYNGDKHFEIPRLPYSTNKFWNFDHGGWFDSDPCTDYLRDPAWYAPDLIKDIISRPVKHEIGCHTFSHIDLSDSSCPREVLQAEIELCRKLAADYGLTLKAFIHPGHHIGHLDFLAEAGFTSYRTNQGNILGFPVKKTGGLWEFKSTMELNWRDGWSAEYHVKRCKTIIDRAIMRNRVCVLWFHPSLSSSYVDKVFPELFAYLHRRRDEIVTTTHTKYVEKISR